MHRAPRIILPVLAAGLAVSPVLAGCGGDEESPDEPAVRGAETSEEAEEATQVWPLTGLPVAADDSVERDYPVIVAKVDNSGKEPQAGLGQADLVVEQLVEGGTTRLAAFFYSRLPKQVGPMRSIRASDIGIVAPLDADIATSGGAPVTRERIREAGIDFVGENGRGFSRDDGRAAPYNLMADLTKVAATRLQDPARPADYLTWGAEGTTIGGREVKRFDVSFSFAHTSGWRWTGEDYRLVEELAPEDDVFRPDSVLVLRVKTVDAGYRDPAGNPVPETVLDGEGQMMLFHDGKMLRGTWTKQALDEPLVLTTQAGEVPVPPGQVWIELVPATEGEVSLR